MFISILFMIFLFTPVLESTMVVDQSILNQNKQEHRQLIQDIENQKIIFTKTDNYQDLNINLKD